MSRRATHVALALLVTLPVALVATFALAPLWRWIDAHAGIEAIGHSGPAAWCFGAVEGVLAIVVLSTFAAKR
ncbi:hypothetical protein [Lysobacter sp. HA35]